MRCMKVEEIAEAIAKLPPGQLVRLRNGIGWQVNGGSVVTSYADNNIDDNVSGGNGAPPANVYR